MTPKRLAQFHGRFLAAASHLDAADRFRAAAWILLDPGSHDQWREFAREYLRWHLGMRRRPLALDAPPPPSAE